MFWFILFYVFFLLIGKRLCFFFFFLNDTAPPEIYPLPLHAALPIARGHLARVVQVLRVDQVVAAQLLLRLDVGSVGGGELAVPDANRRRGLGRLQRFTADVFPALLDALREGVVIGHAFLHIGFRRLLPPLLVLVDQAQVSHGSSQNVICRFRTRLDEFRLNPTWPTGCGSRSEWPRSDPWPRSGSSRRAALWFRRRDRRWWRFCRCGREIGRAHV